MNPDKLKRKYRFRTDQSQASKYLNWTLIVALGIALIYWMFFSK